MIETLAEENFYLVQHMIKKKVKYIKNKMDEEDLFEAGLIGLTKGLKNYNPDEGYKISTFLGKCIENEILHELKRINALKRNYEGIIIELDKTLDGEQNNFESFIKDDSISMEEEFERKEFNKWIIKCTKKLKPKDYELIRKYYGIDGTKKMTLRELMEEYNVSKQCIWDKIKRIKRELKYIMEKEYKTWYN